MRINKTKSFFADMSFFEKNLVHLIFLIPLFFIFTASFTFKPVDFEQRKGVLCFSPKCSWKQITGKPCWTCGMSRAFSSISHGNLKKAKIYNKGAIICYFSLASVAIVLFISYLVVIYRKITNKQRVKK